MAAALGTGRGPSSVAILSTFHGNRGELVVGQQRGLNPGRDHGVPFQLQLPIPTKSPEEEPGPHTTSNELSRDCAAMALLYSVVASAATTLTAAASSIARPSSARRHGELRFCAPGAGRIVKVPAGKCSAVAQAGTAGESSATVGAERPLWLPGTTPPAHLDGT